MRVFATVLALCLISFSGCIVATPGSGISQTEIREVGDFTSISFSGSGVVDVQVGQPRSVEVTLDDNLIHMVRTEVRNGRLHIDTKGSWSSQIGLKVQVSVPQLEGMHTSGSGDVFVHNVSSPNFDASISGSGMIVADGIAESVDVSISGSGDIDVSKLMAGEAAATITGSGEVDIHASRVATANITGSGDINVHGNPERIAESIVGSGDVNRK